MSAFIVHKKHIDFLVTAGLGMERGCVLRWMAPGEVSADAYQRGEPWGPGAIEETNKRRRELRIDTAGQVGAMLWAENQRSVDHRYDEDDAEEPYLYERYPTHIDPVRVLAALACYEYQSCEHPEWAQSEAHAFCDAIRKAAIRRLPGYDKAGWEVTA